MFMMGKDLKRDQAHELLKNDIWSVAKYDAEILVSCSRYQ